MSGRDKWRFAGIGPRERKPRKCRLQAPNITMLARDPRRWVGLRPGKTLVACWIVRYVQVADAARHRPWDATVLVHCTKKVYYIPS
jgi:hypothetical protein